MGNPPPPAELLAMGPPKGTRRRRGEVVEIAQGQQEEEGAGAIDEGTRVQLVEAVKGLMRTQISSGRQVGMQVSVYWKGEEVACVCGGGYRTSESKEWKPVTRDTLLMTYSVCKGVSAVALMTCVDAGECAYSQPVSSVWKEFGHAGKSTMSIADAVSHRGGIPGMSGGVIYAHMKALKRGWKYAWDAGMKFVEKYKPEWKIGTISSYHYVSFSWIIGGIVQFASEKHIYDIVRERIAKKLQVADDMYLGRLPANEHGRAALLENPRAYSKVKWSISKSLASSIEARASVSLGNSKTWRAICLPSSNGFFTSDAVARMYGALSNRGKLADGTQLVSASTVEQVVQLMEDPSNNVGTRGDDLVANLSLGFSPWKNFRVHDEGCAFWHCGMGGCIAYGEPKTRFSIAVFKTAYEPISMFDGENIPPDVLDIVKAVKEVLRIDVRRYGDV